MRVLTLVLLFSCPLLLPALTARAEDGRIEINDATIQAAGGYPFKISLPGSYVLTSDLEAPAGTDAIQIGADAVSLDLNGFAIRGESSCDPGSCAAGAGHGLLALPLTGEDARRTHVSNGKIHGFGDDCLRLGPNATLEDVSVWSCAGDCLFAQEGVLVRGSRFQECGGSGIASNTAGLFTGNVIRQVGLSSAAPPVTAGMRGSDNVCDEDRCPGERRRFLLTTTVSPGNHNGNSCPGGYHLASLFELSDPSELDYDTELGLTQADSGEGPPAAKPGWVRSGAPFADSSQNCNGTGVPWTSGSANDSGTAASLAGALTWNVAAERTAPWVTFTSPCNVNNRSWCIEN